MYTRDHYKRAQFNSKKLPNESDAMAKTKIVTKGYRNVETLELSRHPLNMSEQLK